MSVLVRPKAETLALVTAIAALADFVGAKLHLYSNDMTPNENSVLADFTEVIATGVVAQTVTWSPPFYDANGVPVVSTGELIFEQTAATVLDTCFGCFLTNTAGTKLLAAARLDSPPFAFDGIDKALPLAGKMSVPGGVMDQLQVP